MTAISGLTQRALHSYTDAKGGVKHFLKKNDSEFTHFAEVYFSSVARGVIKGWKKHTQMTMNLTVVTGEVTFVIYDDRPESPTRGEHLVLTVSAHLPQLLHIPFGVWVSFRGDALDEPNVISNCADMEHDPDEAINIELTNSLIPDFWSQL